VSKSDEEKKYGEERSFFFFLVIFHHLPLFFNLLVFPLVHTGDKHVGVGAVLLECNVVAPALLSLLLLDRDPGNKDEQGSNKDRGHKEETGGEDGVHDGLAHEILANPDHDLTGIVRVAEIAPHTNIDESVLVSVFVLEVVLLEVGNTFKDKTKERDGNTGGIGRKTALVLQEFVPEVTLLCINGGCVEIDIHHGKQCDKDPETLHKPERGHDERVLLCARESRVVSNRGDATVEISPESHGPDECNDAGNNGREVAHGDMLCGLPLAIGIDAEQGKQHKAVWR